MMKNDSICPKKIRSHSCGLSGPFRVLSGCYLAGFYCPDRAVLVERKVDQIYIPADCLCARTYQRRIRVRRVGKCVYIVENTFLRKSSPEHVEFTRISRAYFWTSEHALALRVTVDGSITWVRGLVHTHSNLTVCFIISKDMVENLLNVHACTRGLFFAYLNAHARVV